MIEMKWFYTFKTFVTNDNPRDESPEKIRAEILRGQLENKNNLKGIEHREKAIKTAMKEAQAEDIVIIAGKGHEKYQIFKDKKIPHNDFEFCKSYIQNKVNQWNKVFGIQMNFVEQLMENPTTMHFGMPLAFL